MGAPAPGGLRLTDEQRDLCERHLPLARHLVSAFIRRRRFLDRSELLSVAYFALVRATRTYDPASAHCAFATHARHWIDGLLKQSLIDDRRAGFGGIGRRPVVLSRHSPAVLSRFSQRERSRPDDFWRAVGTACGLTAVELDALQRRYRDDAPVPISILSPALLKLRIHAARVRDIAIQELVP